MDRSSGLHLWATGTNPMLRYAILSATFLIPNLALADEASELFKTLYADQLQDVKSSPDKADDVELATTMVDMAKRLINRPKMVELLCESAYTLSARTKRGASTATEAMTLLAQIIPTKKRLAMSRVIAIRKKQYDAAKIRYIQVDAGRRLIQNYESFATIMVRTKNYAGALRQYQTAIAIAAAVETSPVQRLKKAQGDTLAKKQLSDQIKLLTKKLAVKNKGAGSAKQIQKMLEEANEKLAALEKASVQPPSPAPVLAAFEKHINFGSKTSFDQNGQTWEAAKLYKPGAYGYVRTPKTQASQRFGPRGELLKQNKLLMFTSIVNPNSIRFTVAPKFRYKVTMMFQDNWTNNAQENIFSVSIEGKLVIEDIDLTYYPGLRKRLIRICMVDVKDDVLDIDFKATKGKPQIAAIRVVQMGELKSSPR
jgi:hypothetical protein